MSIEVKNSQDVLPVVQAAVARHGTSHEALLPILTEVNQALGYLPGDALTEISRLLRLSEGQLFSIASFYQLLSTQPRGQHVIQFCDSAPCHVVGGRQVWQALEDELGLEPGETSADGQWTLVTISCPGLCGVAPVIIVNDDVYGNVKPERVFEILARYKAAERRSGEEAKGASA